MWPRFLIQQIVEFSTYDLVTILGINLANRMNAIVWAMSLERWALSLEFRWNLRQLIQNGCNIFKINEKGKFINDVYFSSQLKARGLINNWMAEGWIS
jgi:hypothetical protein